MRIVDIRLVPVDPRWLIVKMITDEGVVGYGEATLEGHIPAVMGEIEHWKELLVGQDPRRIQHHWQSLYRHAFYRGGPVICSAISGLEQAMWDITGKWLDQPVWALLGGRVRDRVRLYRHVGGDSLEELRQNARQAVADGFTAVKTSAVVGPGLRHVDTPELMRKAEERMATVREAVGEGVDVGVDLHGRVSPAMAIRVAEALGSYQPMFLEEPCLPENVDALAEVARAITIPVATGERLYTKWGFREVLEKRAAAILQPDLSHAGGLMECRFIAAMAEAHFVAIAPHCPLGPVALAACLQLDACTPNFLVQEHVTLGEGYLCQPFEVHDGYIEVADKPGLGIELDEEALGERVNEGLWRNPRHYQKDGSVADW